MNTSTRVIENPNFKPYTKPILKWAGGKRTLVPKISPLIREILSTTLGRYIEPFMGGGAVAFSLGLYKMLLNDALTEIMDLYRAVRVDPLMVYSALEELSSDGICENTYYKVREMNPESLYDKAARTIYLNKLGFNGLYRLNRKGVFNVPFAKDKLRRKKPTSVLFPTEHELIIASRALATSEICDGDFEQVIKQAKYGDVIYADPPYDETFNSYTNLGFDIFDQERLAFALHDAYNRGAYIFASNNDTPLVRKLYGHWANLEQITERRAINSDIKNRNGASCLLITAFWGRNCE